jgi:GNAT superfamily N-acetyltransferase
MTSVERIDARTAGDTAIVERLASMINEAYAVGEAGMWVTGTLRTTPREVAALIGTGGMLVARESGEIVGCCCVRALDDATADLGFLSAAPGRHGSGIGRRLVARAEELMRERGVRTMQLELLVPREWKQPSKERLREWYGRLGYALVRTAPFEEIATHATAQLATPCEFEVFRKTLTTPSGAPRNVTSARGPR